MQAESAVCQQCGQVAILEETNGLLEPDPRWPGVLILQVINCPCCGIHEQPDDRIPILADRGSLEPQVKASCDRETGG